MVSCNDSNEEEVYESRELPHDVLTMQILTRLPTKSVLRSKLVSKQWYSTLSSYQFGKAHFKLSSLINVSTPNYYVLVQSCRSFYLFVYNEGSGNGLFRLDHDFGVTKRVLFGARKPWFIVEGDELALVGSINGLVCLGSLYDFILWNPVTGRSKKFDSDPDNLLNSSTDCRVSWGFGYVASVDDYKVVRIIESPITSEIMVHVFTLKSNCWRRIDPKLHQHVLGGNIVPGSHYSVQTNRGVLCDETVHWISANKSCGDRRLIAFDLVKETFERNNDVGNKFICVMRGCLSSFSANMRGDVSTRSCNRRSDEADENRIRISRNVHLGECMDLIDFSRNGKFFVHQRYCGGGIGLVDTSATPITYNRLVSFAETKGYIHFTTYVPTLVAVCSESPSH
ncbi:hypothetical protein vseg_014735 [Gypsophila vaccaria]